MDDEKLERLLPCPFCGGIPMFEDVEERQDRRYMVLELRCCVTMSAGLSYGKFRSMTDAAIKTELTEMLIENWNKRSNAEVTGA